MKGIRAETSATVVNGGIESCSYLWITGAWTKTLENQSKGLYMVLV